MKIVIKQYDSAWAQEFKKHKLSLEWALENVSYLSIEHVGSTSIPRPVRQTGHWRRRHHIKAVVLRRSSYSPL
ncbi:hypothetical protein EJ05DRAFT_472186 [Pseudovirgaria hyperparasitica]|uniref:GrpB protein n=1 Tax=Pseudovirgaria hyperparasitica TaxID=470096 RepID=A0A6A6WM28_9PEZI|nr:uncharacterized protein EJ05DRAFT_472186 [Pseudovirgaria hyperparasitica]KAF2763270.1 hypothetical protein EJ05DRAFT_472186 [Pseudovirgaria hyperparasitica]